MESALRTLVELDHALFFTLNGAHCKFLDPIMKFLSNIYVWIPMYLILLGCLFYVFPRKKALFALLAVLLTFLVTDRLSASLLKEGVQRLRPSHMPGWEGTFRLLEGKGGLYSFVSSHAANVFGLATVTGRLFRRKRYSFFIFLWATLVSYSRIYVGKHFPLDVVCGALLGLITGLLVFWLYKWVIKKSEQHAMHRRLHH
ncbi:MAG: phosphatase PAP2 family protein [Bacteroidales bacterium]|nr:phosphatase PAP2 family protein [Bacteroidales bacterium]